MARSRWMELPRKVAVGSGVLLELPDICIDLKLQPRALIITGPHTQNVVGKAIFELLEDSGLMPETLICSASKMEEVDRAERLVQEIRACFLIGAGGGRSIDIAKLASLKADIPFLSVPTAASHDGICSSQASLTINGETSSVPADAPLAIVADTKIISQAPARLLAAGCGDIISNYTAILDWQLANRLRNEEYSEYASALSGMTARMIVENAPEIRPGLEESAKIVVKALISSGVAMSIAGSSRPASGSEHKFAHAMNHIAPGRALHGELCGLGTIIMMYLHGGDWKTIRNALSQVGAPTTAAGADLEPEMIVEALISARNIRPERYTILDSGLNRIAAARAAEATGII
ncbi:Glycerol-1-phosphate dehydrogenase [NAD(P)+] [uncultured archaeon]|nr:Glycerol-1-phosphate dehydrogenase [NAD(P)+] [uncultured archaeon]